MNQSAIPTMCLPLSLFNQKTSRITDKKKSTYLIFIKSSSFYSHSEFNIISKYIFKNSQRGFSTNETAHDRAINIKWAKTWAQSKS